MRVQSSLRYKAGDSKNLFQCSLCPRVVHASQLINDINGLQVRDARLFCSWCKKKFNALSPLARAELLRRRFEEYYGNSQYIYALNDPRDGKRRYVGRAKDPHRRYQQHLRDARMWRPLPTRLPVICSHQHMPTYMLPALHSSKKWIAALLKDGLKPNLEILEIVIPPVKVCEREMRWISQSIKDGYDLLNAENSSEELRRLLNQQKIESFLNVNLDKLIRSKFPNKVECLLGWRDTGWRRAVLIHTVYKARPKLVATSEDSTWYRLGRA